VSNFKLESVHKGRCPLRLFTKGHKTGRHLSVSGGLLTASLEHDDGGVSFFLCAPYRAFYKCNWQRWYSNERVGGNMDDGAKLSNKGRGNKSGKDGKGKGGKIRGGKAGKGKVNNGKKVRLRECMESLIELHKLQFVLLGQLDKEIDSVPSRE